MLSQDEVRFLAVLVQKGHLDREAAAKVMGTSQDPRHANASLERLVTGLKLLTPERFRFLESTGGEDVPPVPGYDYVAYAGFGGTSVVFHGRERKTGRDVALKIMHKELHADALQQKRFVHEANLLIDLAHDNVVKGYRVGHVKEEDGTGRLVFIMEWIPGRSCLELLRDGREFTEDLALYIILQSARALRAMHSKGILHRDIKPDNILLTDDNVVKLIDLGFATMLDEAGGGEDTTLGTAAYMSPEQAQGTGNLDARSDIYSLGATLYQIIVGELPFAGEGSHEQLAARILEALSSPELQSRRISPHMNYFIRKMMEQDRDFRYGSIDELVSDIEQQIRGKKTLDFGGVGSADSSLLDRTLDAEDGSDLEPLDGDDDGPAAPPPPRFPTRRRRR